MSPKPGAKSVKNVKIAKVFGVRVLSTFILRFISGKSLPL
jgi:hypothetical protein